MSDQKETLLTMDARRDASIRRLILLEGLVNVAVFAAKLVVGIASGSLLIIGDAIHSLTDAVNNVIAWFVVRLSSTPPDRKHPYGHRKFETLAIFFLASLLMVLAFELALQAIKKTDANIESSSWGLSLMLVVLAVNIALTLWQQMWARRLQSDILHADASHTLADVLTSIAVIVGWQLSARGYPWLDQLCALAVSALIFYLAYGLFKKALPVLTDEFALDPELLSVSIESVAGVRSVNRVRSRWVGVNKSVDLIISVDPELSIAKSHDIATAVEQLVEQKFSVQDVSIHVEPFDKNV